MGPQDRHGEASAARLAMRVEQAVIAATAAPMAAQSRPTAQGEAAHGPRIRSAVSTMA